jgi:hypothetical protein
VLLVHTPPCVRKSDSMHVLSEVTVCRSRHAAFYFHAGEGMRRGSPAAARLQSLGREHLHGHSSFEAHVVRPGRSQRATPEHCKDPTGSKRLRSQ